MKKKKKDCGFFGWGEAEQGTDLVDLFDIIRDLGIAHFA